MARNEEKQLARLNRFYLHQQKEDELKKRPPRPKLETLTSVEDVKKWLPTILRDIDFYVKQMEVPCYPERQIEEFERRIDHHRGEYKAFIRKLHQLEPDWKTTPWSDRQYVRKRLKIEADHTFTENDTTAPDSHPVIVDTTRSGSTTLKNFMPLSTPVLTNDGSYQHCYGFEKPTIANTRESELGMQDEPLQFNYREMDCSQQNVSAKSKPSSNEQGDSYQLEQSNGTRESLVCTEMSTQFYNDNCQPKTDLMLQLPVIDNTSKQSHHHIVSLEDKVECNSCTAQFHARADNEPTSHKDCKCESGVVEEKGQPKASLVSSCSESGVVEEKGQPKASLVSSCSESGVGEERGQPKASLVSSSNTNSCSGISLFGTLNIPYTDSSSSEGET